MKRTQDYTVISLDEFFENCEIDTIDELFQEMKKESDIRTYMKNKSLSEYLKNCSQKKSKYDVLRAKALI